MYLKIKTRLFSIIVSAIFLISCGGGGSPGGGSNTLTGQGTLQYQGITTVALLEPVNVGAFLHILFSENTVFSNSPGDMSSSSDGFCQNNGSLTFSENLNQSDVGKIEFTASNCLLDGVVYDGNFNYVIHETQFNGMGYVIIRSTISFIDTHLVANDLDIIINGTIYENTENQYPPKETTLNAVILDNLTNVYYRVELTYDVYHELPSNFSPVESITGRIYDSRYGYVDVSTSEPLKYNDWQTKSYPNNGGRLIFSGGNNSVSTFSVSVEEVFESSTIDMKKFFNRLEIDQDGDGENEYDVIMLSSDVERGGLNDIGDGDSDGMPNSWEEIYDLNPTEESDALVDTDNDGYSNLLEFRKFGDPNSSAIVPIVTDLDFKFTQAASVRAGQETTVQFTINNPNPQYGAQNIVVNISKSDNVEWLNIGPCEIDSLNNNNLICSIDYIEQNFGRAIGVTVIADQPSQASFTGTVRSSTYDPDEGNNIDTKLVEFTERETELGMELVGNYSIAAIGSSQEFEYQITQWADEARNAVFTMNIPALINIDSASFAVTSGNTSSGNCEITTQVVCHLGTIPMNAATYKATITIRYTSVVVGTSQIISTIMSEGIELNPNDNLIESDIYIGSPLTNIQSLVDSAIDGDTIQIPPGLYVGTLDFNEKALRLESMNSVDRATLVGSHIVTGSNSIVSNLIMRGSSITLSGEGSFIEDNEFLGITDPFNNGAGITINGLDVSTTIRRNRFSGYNSGNCTLINIRGYSSARIENNLFYNNVACDAIVAARFFSPMGNVLNRVIANNTLVNNRAGILVDPLSASSTNEIINNIVVNHGDIGIQSTSVLSSPSDLDPIVRNNIIYNNNTNTLGITLTPADGNLELDPLFSDPANDDYYLPIGSPAIDSGTNVNAPLEDLDLFSRPVDGDGDGVFINDIGAYEFNPN